MVDLSSAKSFEEVVERCVKFHDKNKGNLLLGRGWDQNLWLSKEFPNNALLNQYFKDIPVLLKRVDGHAAIANDVALRLAGIHAQSKVAGGEFLTANGILTGVLIDNAVDLVEKALSKPDRNTQVRAFLDAQQACLDYGITAITDAGLDAEIVSLADSLQKAGLLKMHLNLMLSLGRANYDWIEGKGGPIKKENLQVCGFKMYADGALGSRGACLLAPYQDRHHHYGLLLTSIEDMQYWVKTLAQNKHAYQLNTHAIGDSSNRLVLDMYARYLAPGNNRRWRIEHAQVVNPADFNKFGKNGIVPSVQPTHATSDMFWALDRLGSTRIQSAYAYKTLLEQLGWLPLGTDFPVEHVSPFYTFFAAVARTTADGKPLGGFQIENALSREEALKGISTWAAKGAFLENEMGSLLPGTRADFVLLPNNLLTDSLSVIRNLKATQTWILGKRAN